MAKSLYIHIPFCNQICSYCDFPKVFSRGQDTEAYLDALLTELTCYEKNVGFAHLKTIYIGGGTPTVLTVKQLERLFGYLHSVIHFHQLEEVSIEANPESLNDIEKIACLKAQGVTRVSLGVQTFQENLLNRLERTHTKQDVIDVINKLSTVDVEINVDLIYGIPTQTLQQLEDDLNTLLSLPITHVSAYSLILEPHTKFHVDYMKDKLDLLDNTLEANMFETVIHKLTTHGFSHYEISNYTKSKRSIHNETYWKNEPYLAVGLGAHGQLEQKGRMRYENTRSITAYKKTLAKGNLPISTTHVLTKNEQIEESMFLGLRLLEGINLTQLSDQYNVNIYELYKPQIDQLLTLDYVDLTSHVLKLTKKGLMMANDVFEAFLL
ncbi:MAG: radical SAM family heme chaperone HemW [Defluviitaleaceae bacterium]|nr:radical SAM family heme chaperone HemW [Defluviitaleaceae bacterium]